MISLWLRHTSLKRKLMVIVMLTTIAALMMTTLVFLTYEFARYRGALVRNLSSLAEIIGANTTAALAFKDPRAAEETLRGLKAESHIVSAYIYTPDGSPFAGYSRPGYPPEAVSSSLEEGYRFTYRELELVQPIRLDGKRLGTIFIRSTLNEMYSRLLEYAGIFGLVMIASSCVAFVLSSRLQGLVSEPILHLAQTAKTVSQAKDYSVRAIKTGEDEIGSLIDGFNEMLAQIQLRDDALQKGREELEGRVQARTEDLRREVGERVRYAAELEKALQVKAEFLSVMSHELRTPLNVIMGYARIVLDEMFGAVSEGQKKALTTILRCSNDLLMMVNDIMTATKIEADKLEVEWEEVQPAEILEDLKSVYGAQLLKNGVSLQWDYSTPLPAFVSDGNKIKHILQNLINNALKFTENGTVTVIAETLQCEGNPYSLVLKVSDTGIGIPSEMHPVIFQMFRQVDSTMTRSHDGVGLGLFIVKKFAEYLGGTVGVESEIGRGSTFAVVLPLARRREVEATGLPLRDSPRL